MLTSLHYIRSLRLSQSHTEVPSVSLPKGHPRASLVEWTLNLARVVTTGPNRHIQNSLLWLKVGGKGGVVCVGMVSLSCLTLLGAAISLVTLNSAHSPSEISSLAQVLTAVQLLDVLCPVTHCLMYRVAPTLGSAALLVPWQDLFGIQGPSDFYVEACSPPRLLPR